MVGPESGHCTVAAFENNSGLFEAIGRALWRGCPLRPTTVALLKENRVVIEAVFAARQAVQLTEAIGVARQRPFRRLSEGCWEPRMDANEREWLGDDEAGQGSWRG